MTLLAASYAHRGLHDAHRPENSIAAFAAAKDAGYGVELDVHVSRDGIPYVLHDRDTFTATGVPGQLADLVSTDADHLRLTNGEPLPRLASVLAAVGPDVPLLIEVKPTRQARRAATVVAAQIHGRAGDVTALQSFDPRVVWHLHRAVPSCPVGQLWAYENPWGTRWWADRQLTNALVRPDFLAVEVPLLTAPVTAAWARRLPLACWTVRTEDELAHARAHGASVIFEAVRP